MTDQLEINIVGFGNKAGVGKSTACEILKEWYTSTNPVNAESFTVIFAFAEPLKAACQELFSLNDDQLFDTELKEQKLPYWNLSPRQIFQQAGTALRQTFGDDLFVRCMERRVHKLHDELSDDMGLRTINVLIEDVRFPIEAEAIRHWGGRVFRINRPDAPGTQHQTHESESAIDSYQNWTGVIENNGTLGQFENAVVNAVVGD